MDNQQQEQDEQEQKLYSMIDRMYEEFGMQEAVKLANFLGLKYGHSQAAANDCTGSSAVRNGQCN